MTDVVLVGVGELGGVFGTGLLRGGSTVIPVGRETDVSALAEDHPEPDLVLVTVGEADLAGVLRGFPATWKRRTGLVQNELVPSLWQQHGVEDPTVAIVWFEKKPGRALVQILPTLVAGPQAHLLETALEAVDVDVTEIDEDRLVDELVAKNLYILTTNLVGLRVDGTVGELWSDHRALVEEAMAEILNVQVALVGERVDIEGATARVAAAIDADPEHRARGRSAPERMRRALHHAAELGVHTPTLQAISDDVF